MLKRYKPTGLSIPIELMQKIDMERGDVSRSRYILRILEKVYRIRSTKKKEVDGEYLSFQSASCFYPDLITDECPLGCDDCEEIYVNEQTGHRIICRCNKCGHKKECEALEVG